MSSTVARTLERLQNDTERRNKRNFWRATTATSSGFNQDFLCVRARFGFRFYQASGAPELPLVRRDGKLVPSSWGRRDCGSFRRLAEIQESLWGGFGGIHRVRTAPPTKKIIFAGAHRARRRSARIISAITAPRLPELIARWAKKPPRPGPR